MKCTNCGEPLKQGSTFCTNCGTAAEHAAALEPIETPAAPKSGFVLSKSVKITSVIVLVLIIAAFAGYKTLQTMYKPAKIVEKFETAVHNKKSHDLASLLNNGQDKMKVTESDASALIAYFEENPDIYDAVKDDLRKGSQMAGSQDDGFSYGGIFSLTDLDKKWGIIRQYGISFTPFYLSVTADQPNVEITINSKEAGKLDSDNKRKFGPYLPIDQEVAGSFKGPYDIITDSVYIEAAEEESNRIDVELDLSGRDIKLYTNYDNATVYVNGKSTGKSIDELDPIGPVSNEGNLKLSAEVKVDGKTLSTGTLNVTPDEGSVELYFDDTAVLEAAREREEAAEEAAAAEEEAREDIIDVLYDHYSNISNGWYSDAYDLFSSTRKSKVSYDAWSKGLENNVSDEVQSAEIQSLDGNKAVVAFQMVSRDQKENGDYLVQTFGGTWTLVKEYAAWRLDSSKVKKLDSRTE